MRQAPPAARERDASRDTPVRTQPCGFPVIVTTADPGAGIAAEIPAEVAVLGADRVHKPIRPAELRALLTALPARAAFSSAPAAC